MKKLENLKPFPKFCCSIGYIPSSYKISMTYEEQLLWLCNFLENTVIPTANKNGQAVEELQNLYLELKQYVDDYFSNLDIHTEINNKLDEMATDGTLENIINQEIFGKINQNLEELNYLNNKNILIIGDSYALGTSADGTQNSYAKILAETYLNSSSYKIIAEGGAGFCGQGTTSHKNFLEMLQAQMPTITPSDYGIVLVAGGYNDATNTHSEISENVQAFMAYVEQHFPKAKHYIAMIGNNSDTSSLTRRKAIDTTVYWAYADKYPYDFMYLTGSETILKNYNLMSSDLIHPNQNGYKAIARQLYQGITGAGIGNIEQQSAIVFNPFGGYSVSANNSYTQLINRMLYVHFGLFTISKNTGEFTLDQAMLLTRININARENYPENLVFFSVTAKVSTTEGVKYCHGYIKIENGSMYYYWWNDENLSTILHVTSIEFMVPSCTIPALLN